MAAGRPTEFFIPFVFGPQFGGSLTAVWSNFNFTVIERLKPGVTAAALIEFARARLATYKCPTNVQFVEQLPHTASGKLQRSALREPTAAGAPEPIAGDDLVSGVSDA